MPDSSPSSTETIVHHGTVCLLTPPSFKKDKVFRFRFIAITPEPDEWAFRLLDSSEPAAAREVILTDLLLRFHSLRATDIEIVGHPVGALTIYLPQAGGGVEKISERAEAGTKIMPVMAAPVVDITEPPQPPLPRLAPPELPDLF